ncbi:hypothetical protein KJ885_04905 [Patescibacteria group bacterium]|nr:hypothetical protein [Patescibacteria group bacterium]
MKKFLQKNYKPIVVLIMIIAMWVVFYKSDFIQLSDLGGISNPVYWAIKLQTLLVAEALILISGSLLLWLGGKNKK